MQLSKRNFFIAALPRSRTGWLANLLTTNGSFCFHEIIGRTGELPSRQEGYVGSAETCVDLIPEGSRTLVIHRPVDECMASVANSFDIDNNALDILRPMMRKEAANLHKIQGMHINFHSLDDNLEQIWEYLIPDVPVDLDRISEMTRMNVKINTRNLTEVV